MTFSINVVNKDDILSRNLQNKNAYSSEEPVLFHEGLTVSTNSKRSSANIGETSDNI